MANNEEYAEYPIYRGLQRPMEFMGFQGRYITWAAITCGATLLGFMLFYAIFNFLVALIFAVCAVSIGGGAILLKKRKGLHTKQEEKGVFVYARYRSH